MFQLVIASSAARERLAAEYIGREYRVHGHDALALHACVRWTAQPVMLIRSSPPLVSAESASAGRGSRMVANDQSSSLARMRNSLWPKRGNRNSVCHDVRKFQRLLFSGRGCGESPLAPTTDAQ